MRIFLSQNYYKIRLKIASKGRGRSGGVRVITCVVAVAETVFPLLIYDKSEQGNMIDKYLNEWLELPPPSTRRQWLSWPLWPNNAIAYEIALARRSGLFRVLSPRLFHQILAPCACCCRSCSC